MDFLLMKVFKFINNSLRTITMAQQDKDSKQPLSTCPVGHLKVAEVATMTDAIMVIAGTTPMVKFTYA